VSKVAVGGFEALRQTLPVRRRTLVSFGEPIALRMEAELERAADAAASADDRFEGGAQAQFLERLRSGDAVTFNRLVEERHGDIYALLYRLTEDPEEARDLTQETFLQAFRNIAGFRGEADLRTWLYRIAVNQARNRWRWWKRRRRDKTVSLDAPTSDENSTPLSAGLANDRAADPEEQALARERERALLAALATLSRPYREVIVLRDIEGLSYEEVAQALDMNIGTVKSRLSRGRDELRRRLEGSL
jgi:RNA polymerase sigma-70 factor (ECF subfamily)